MHEQGHLLPLGEGVPSPDPWHPHSKRQAHLPGVGGLLFNPLPLWTWFLCRGNKSRRAKLVLLYSRRIFTSTSLDIPQLILEDQSYYYHIYYRTVIIVKYKNSPFDINAKKYKLISETDENIRDLTNMARVMLVLKFHFASTSTNMKTKPARSYSAGCI